MEEITITFVCNHYPREMLRILKKERKIAVRKIENGIYWLENEFLPIQIILNHELSSDENRWLNSLRTDIKADKETDRLIRDYKEHKEMCIRDSSIITEVIGKRPMNKKHWDNTIVKIQL